MIASAAEFAGLIALVLIMLVAVPTALLFVLQIAGAVVGLIVMALSLVAFGEIGNALVGPHYAWAVSYALIAATIAAAALFASREEGGSR